MPVLISLANEIDTLRTPVREIVEVQAPASNAMSGLLVEDPVAIGLRFANRGLGTFMPSHAAGTRGSLQNARCAVAGTAVRRGGRSRSRARAGRCAPSAP